MKWASILSEERTSQAAALDASARLRRTLGDAAADLVVVFASNHHAESYEDIAGILARELGGPTLIGCRAHSVTEHRTFRSVFQISDRDLHFASS